MLKVLIKKKLLIKDIIDMMIDIIWKELLIIILSMLQFIQKNQIKLIKKLESHF